MALNQKLTPIIAGRVIKSIEQTDKSLSLSFADGSCMKIKTSAPATIDDLNGRTVKSIRQKGTAMTIIFDDDASASIALAEATSSVMLRDANGVMEYAD
jgi:hypothetical protein